MAASTRSPRLLISCAALSLTLGACDDAAQKNCAALGDEVAPGLPAFALGSGVDCKVGEWTDEVERLEAARSVEIWRDSTAWRPLLRARSEGTVAFMGDRFFGLDADGGIEWETRYTNNRRIERGNFAVDSNDRVYVADAFGGDAKVVIFDGDTGQQIRQFIVPYDDFGGFSPTIALRDDELWLSHVSGDIGFEGAWISSSLIHFSSEGEELSRVEFEHDDYNQPAIMEWSPSGVLSAVGWLGVYTLDHESGAVLWSVNDTNDQEWSDQRSLTTTSEAVVIAHSARSNDGSANRWQIVAYAIESGTELWRQEFVGSGFGQEQELQALSDGSVVFVGGEYGSPEQAQPMVVVIDAEGELVAGERLDVSGDATGVAVDASGSMYVLGGTGLADAFQAQFERIFWMRRYDTPLF